MSIKSGTKTVDSIQQRSILSSEKKGNRIRNDMSKFALNFFERIPIINDDLCKSVERHSVARTLFEKVPEITSRLTASVEGTSTERPTVH